MIDLERFPHAAECALGDEWRHGLWDEENYVWILVPVAQYEVLDDCGFLAVGRPGVDGIAFGYRAGVAGFWAYFPLEGRFEPLAPSVAEFVNAWFAGTVAL